MITIWLAKVSTPSDAQEVISTSRIRPSNPPDLRYEDVAFGLKCRLIAMSANGLRYVYLSVGVREELN
jgi:hypothetical protein